MQQAHVDFRNQGCVADNMLYFFDMMQHLAWSVDLCAIGCRLQAPGMGLACMLLPSEACACIRDVYVQPEFD